MNLLLTTTLKNHPSLGILLELEQACAATVREQQLIAKLQPEGIGWKEVPTARPEDLGSALFRSRFGTRLAYMAGAMANGIASEALVVAMSKAGMLASFGAAGLSRARINEAIRTIQAERNGGPFAINLIHTPGDPEREMDVVQDCLAAGVGVLEASAFLKLEPSIVCYRAAGLVQEPDGSIRSRTQVIAKLSRREVADQFLRPAPREMLDALVAAGRITRLQATLAESVPVATCITAEADSGGHTDRQPLVTLLPWMLRLRDEAQTRHAYAEPVLIGAAGGLGTPASIAAAFAMGADYVVTGSINQASLEAGTSAKVKEILASAESTDIAMAPAADMFEMGVQVQVLKRGTLFPMRAQRLGEVYRQSNGLEDIAPADRQNFEKQIFRTGLEDIWAQTQAYLSEANPRLLSEALQSPKKRMSAIFRWYLGQASKWAISGQADRVMDYQIWCGPAMGAFNAWTAGTGLALPAQRGVVQIAEALMRGAAFLQRLQVLRAMGLPVPGEFYSLDADAFLAARAPAAVPAPSVPVEASPAAPAQPCP